MGLSCGSLKLPKLLILLLLHLQLLISSHLKSLLKIFPSHLPLFPRLTQSGLETNTDRPPASLVPLPLYVITDSIKKMIPVTRFVKRDSVEVCVVCLDGVEGKDEIRELSSCKHVFHVKCLDGWIDKGHVSCPLCRAKLVAESRHGSTEDGKDPWRKERMIYLFGEDYHFTDS